MIKPSLVMPALLTRMSRRPCFSATSSTMRCTASPSAMSQVRCSQVPPAAMISASSDCNCSALRATATTWRPSFARRLAIPRPIPRLAPVTIATRLSMQKLLYSWAAKCNCAAKTMNMTAGPACASPAVRACLRGRRGASIHLPGPRPGRSMPPGGGLLRIGGAPIGPDSSLEPEASGFSCS